MAFRTHDMSLLSCLSDIAILPFNLLWTRC